MKNSLFIGKIAGIKIFLHWTFPIIIFWIIYSNLRRGLHAEQVTWSFVFILALFVCVTVHEVSNALTAKRYHIKPKIFRCFLLVEYQGWKICPKKPMQELIVAQISEFCLIFSGLELAVGHITKETLGLITIGLSTYLILYSHQIFNKLSPFLSLFERKKSTESEDSNITTKKYELILLGLGRFGNRLADKLDEQPEIIYLGVDFDPSIIVQWKENGRDIFFGDIDDPEMLEYVPYQGSKTIVSTIPDVGLSKQFIKELQRKDYKGKIYITASTDKDYQELSNLEIEGILRPHYMAASNFYTAFIKNNLK
jgi:hypothetical protein